MAIFFPPVNVNFQQSENSNFLGQSTEAAARVVWIFATKYRAIKRLLDK
jgi:hypothetical protein